MPKVTDKRIEAEARRVLGEKISRFPWHQGCLPDERRRRIEADVDSLSCTGCPLRRKLAQPVESSINLRAAASSLRL